MPTRVLARRGSKASVKKGPGTTASYNAFAKSGKAARANSNPKSKSNAAPKKSSTLKKSKNILTGKGAGKKLLPKTISKAVL